MLVRQRLSVLAHKYKQEGKVMLVAADTFVRELSLSWLSDVPVVTGAEKADPVMS